MSAVTTDRAEQLEAAVALSGLHSLGHRRLRRLLADRSPLDAWELATSGDAAAIALVTGREDAVASLAPVWQVCAARRGSGLLERCAAAGVAVCLHPSVADRLPRAREDEGLPEAPYPERLVDDPDPPAVLFARGPVDGLTGPTVAIVGTRRCTGAGAGMARELGRELAAAGVRIVSGLALGIDGAAHRGVRDARLAHPDAAPPVGVVGSGHDVVYPTRNRDLWTWVGDDGLLLSEAPLGERPVGWRFPARNRIIAGLADLVVVVESHAAGGSLHTVTEAITRGVDVMVVPGSVRLSSTAGTNQLLAEGCAPVRDASDVLVALGLVDGRRRAGARERRRAPSPAAATVLDAFDWEPVTLEHLAARTSLSVPAIALALEELLAGGWVTVDGGWYERREEG